MLSKNYNKRKRTNMKEEYEEESDEIYINKNRR